MAKKVINSYIEFDATAGTVGILGFHKLSDLFLITNVTTNTIIYNFSDPALGGTILYNEVTEISTITLDLSLSGLGMNDADSIQIIVDDGETKIEVSDSLLDPVHKIRVSTPENLIDTDFEYGLQPTKWETLELLNNVPSFYTSDGELSLTIVDTVEANVGSDLITVYCSDVHALPVGTPIDVQGLSSRTAEGKFLISAVPTTNTFTYKANAPQTQTGEIGSIYTTITPGTFYTGSQIPFDAADGIVSDEAEPSSKITVTTEDPHGFSIGNNFYLLNSVGGKSLKMTNTTTSDAPDGRPYVDHVESLAFSANPDYTKTETKQMKSRHSVKFDASAIDTSANTITWTAHGLKSNDVVFYMPPVYDTTIGGLSKFRAYYVKKIDDNAISLTLSRSGSAINFTNAGTHYFGRHSLHLAYEVSRSYYPAYSSYMYVYTRNASYGGSDGSGWDLRQTYNGGYGLGHTSGQTVRWTFFSSSYQSHHYYMNYYMGGRYYAPRSNGNFTFDTSTGLNLPNRYNIFEDYNRFSTGSTSYTTLSGSSAQIRCQKSYYTNPYRYYRTSNYYASSLTEFFVPMIEDDEADSFYIANHGLTTGDTISFSTQSATYGGYSGTNLPDKHTGSTSVTNSTNVSDLADGDHVIDVKSDNRFSLSGTRISGANGQYTVTGSRQNATANTLYFPNHGLNANTDIIPTAVDSGVLPTSTAGVITPFSSMTSSGTNVNSWSTMNTFINTYLTANTAGLTSMVTANNANSTRVFNSGVSSGNSSMNYYDLNYTTNYAYYSTYGGVNSPSSNLNMSNLKSTRPYNIFSGTNVANRNNLMVATDWTANSTLPYYFWTRESGRASDNEYWYGYLRDGFSLPSQGSMQITGDDDNNSYTTGGKEYRWSISRFKHVRSGGPSLVYVNGHFFNNTDWQTYTANTTMTRATNNNTYWYSYWGGSYYWKQVVEFGLVFMVGNSDTAFNTSANFVSFMEGMLADWNTNFVYPALTGGNTYKADIISDNRIGFKVGNAKVNITNSGTENLQIQTKAELGVIDGTYKSTEVAESSFKFGLDQKIFGTTIDLDATTVTAEFQIKVSNNADHTFITGTKVTYDANSNTALTNLTDATDYYVVAVDEQHVALCANVTDAINKNNFIQIAAGTGTHKIKTESVAGIAEADGTVAIEADKNKVTGTTTLFKRYFKVGDRIFIKDTTNTPGELLERKVTSISDDTIMTVDRNFDVTNTSTKHFLETKVYVKPDGYSVHRPFDGGVEIAAGTSPYSQVTRQTRKYFRYQSGKGIQTSLAINFNPPVVVETLQGATGLTPSAEAYAVTAVTGAYVFNGGTYTDEQNPILTLYRGGTYTFNMNATGHPFYFTTDDNTGWTVGGYVGEYTTGVTGSRTESGAITFVVPANAPDDLYYQCANHQNMYGQIRVENFETSQGTIGTKYPHRLSVGSNITVSGAGDAAYNGNHRVSTIVDDFTFKYGMTVNPGTSVPNGIVKFNMNGYTGAATRAGMFDQQNGFFFEYNGSTLSCVRRSSVTQLSGTATLVNNSGKVTGNPKTNFTGQLAVSDYIVLRGQSYKVTKIESKSILYVQPQFKGKSTTGAIITKTEDVKVPQLDWNLDKCNGTGRDGFVLNINKIQMAYMDYSWYGAGKIRFGFKDAHGHVRYVHQFVHNNRLDEAYMRSGNIPAKYEIENAGTVDYAPTLFHWGTSVIMDGTFDDDKAYLFTAPSKSLSFTNGESSTVNTTGTSSIQGEWSYEGGWSRNWYVRLQVASSNAEQFYAGLALYTAGNELTGQEVSYTQYSGSNFYVYIYVGRSRNTPAVYPSVGSGVALSLGAPASGSGDMEVNLGTAIIPLVSLRLAPSVDSNLSGNLGERDIINRMQLKLNQVGLILTHDCEVKLILNGDLSSVAFENVKNPSLSQLIKHSAGDTVTGGTEVFSFRATGGGTDQNGKKLTAASNFDLGDIIDLGNSILGGDGTFPNGPDILTVAIQVVDTGGIGASNPFTSSARITWSESQA